ncbi:MAG: hypothetical protein JRN12_07050 [Nitrososphaerota archaeon]|jgi:hypothetical protein|nr:hypothetical protein [Nitrososphaerota archaeon]
MPKEITDKDQFAKMLEGASEVRVARKGDSAKVKLRMRDALYTFKTTSEGADALVKGTKKLVVEF